MIYPPASAMIVHMAGRRTNVALLWASVLALISGVGAFLVGTSSGRWVVVAHGVGALALVVLAPWKSAIVRRGWQRGRPGRWASIWLTITTIGAIGTGFLLVTGVRSVGPLTAMQAHVTLGLLAISFTLLHTLQRPIPNRSVDLSRRNALRAGGTIAAAGGLWLAAEGSLHLSGSVGAKRRFTGSHEISDPAEVPFTQWINDSVQHLDTETHRISVLGMELTPERLDAGGDSVEATLDCTGGWYTTQEWRGTRLDHLLGEVAGSSVVVRSVTGYWRRFPLEQADMLYLVTRMAGEPLRDGHGGPARLVAPGRRGYWWVKWVDSVEVDDLPPWWQPPLPTA